MEHYPATSWGRVSFWLFVAFAIGFLLQPTPLAALFGMGLVVPLGIAAGYLMLVAVVLHERSIVLIAFGSSAVVVLMLWMIDQMLTVRLG